MSFTTINDAAVAFTAGKLAKAEFVAFASERQWDNKPILSLMGKGLDIVDVSAILTAHAAIAAAEAKKATSGKGLSCKISLRGAISLYGNGQWPDTKYAEQWERVLQFVNAPADNPIAKLIAENKPQEYVIADVLAKDKSGKDKEYVAEVMAGKHPNAKIVGEKMLVGISRKPAK